MSGEGPAFTPDIRARLYAGDEVVFGKGISELLQRCERSGSLNMAAKEMQMSYRKALYVVHRAEKGFGQPLLKKTIGGAGGGGSQLTAFGQQLVEVFSRLEDELDTLAADRLKAAFPALAFAAKRPDKPEAPDTPGKTE